MEEHLREEQKRVERENRILTRENVEKKFNPIGLFREINRRFGKVSELRIEVNEEFPQRFLTGGVTRKYLWIGLSSGNLAHGLGTVGRNVIDSLRLNGRGDVWVQKNGSLRTEIIVSVGWRCNSGAFNGADMSTAKYDFGKRRWTFVDRKYQAGEQYSRDEKITAGPKELRKKFDSPRLIREINCRFGKLPNLKVKIVNNVRKLTVGAETTTEVRISSDNIASRMGGAGRSIFKSFKMAGWGRIWKHNDGTPYVGVQISADWICHTGNSFRAEMFGGEFDLKKRTWIFKDYRCA